MKLTERVSVVVTDRRENWSERCTLLATLQSDPRRIDASAMTPVVSEARPLPVHSRRIFRLSKKNLTELGNWWKKQGSTRRPRVVIASRSAATLTQFSGKCMMFNTSTSHSCLKNHSLRLDVCRDLHAGTGSSVQLELERPSHPFIRHHPLNLPPSLLSTPGPRLLLPAQGAPHTSLATRSSR